MRALEQNEDAVAGIRIRHHLTAFLVDRGIKNVTKTRLLLRSAMARTFLFLPFLCLLAACDTVPRLERIEPEVLVDGQVRQYEIRGVNFSESTRFEINVAGLVGSRPSGPSDHRAAEISPDGNLAKIWLGPLVAIGQDKVTISVTSLEEETSRGFFEKARKQVADFIDERRPDLQVPVSTDWAGLRSQLEKLTVQEKVGQTLIVGLDLLGYDRQNAIEITHSTLPKLVRENGLGGIFIKRNNLPNLPPNEQYRGAARVQFTQTLTQLSQAAAAEARLPPLFVAVDQEGGRNNTFSYALTQFPAQGFLASQPDLRKVFEVGAASAKELRSLGINVIFGPIVDVDREGDAGRGFSPIAGLRTFGANHNNVTMYGASLFAGYLSEGILPVAKHYPGHGFAKENPHYTFVELDIADPDEFEKVDLAPFRTLVRSGLPAVMTAHVSVPALGFDTSITYSENHIAELRESDPVFTGLILTDDMTFMTSALTVGGDRPQLDSYYDAVRLAHLASNDIIVMATVLIDAPEDSDRFTVAQLPRLISDLAQVYSADSHKHEELDNRVLRILRAKSTLGITHESSDILTPSGVHELVSEHLDAAESIVKSSVVVLSENGRLTRREDLRLFGDSFGPLSVAAHGSQGGLRNGDRIVVVSPVHYWAARRSERKDYFFDQINSQVTALPISVELSSYPLVSGLDSLPFREDEESRERLEKAREIWADPESEPPVIVDYAFYRNDRGHFVYEGSSDSDTSEKGDRVDAYLDATVANVRDLAEGARYVIFGIDSVPQLEILERFLVALESESRPAPSVIVLMYREPYLLSLELLRNSRVTVVWAPSAPDRLESIESLFGKIRVGDYRSVPYRFPGRTTVQPQIFRWENEQVLVNTVPSSSNNLTNIGPERIAPWNDDDTLLLIIGLLVVLLVLTLIRLRQRRQSRSDSESGRKGPWVSDVGKDTVLVFVHGYLSNSEKCWGGMSNENWWPRLAKNDRRMSGIDVFAAEYDTQVGSDWSIDESEKDLFELLDSRADSRRVLGAKQIVFVCHSLGGVIIRRLLVRRRAQFAGKRVGVLLFASPSLGSIWANILSPVLRFTNSSAGVMLRLGSEKLNQLNEEFRDFLADDDGPEIYGREFWEHKFYFWSRWLPFKFPRVVSRTAAGVFFPDPLPLPNTNHSTIVSPKGWDDRPHVALLNFLMKNGFVARTPNEEYRNSDAGAEDVSPGFA